jgi:sugar lactone lactonase YvrE
MKRSSTRMLAAAACCIAMLGLSFAPANADPPRPIGDSRVVADLPDFPGFPEGIAVSGNKMYVAAPAQFGNSGPGKIHVFDAHTGAPLDDYDIPAHAITPDHGLVGVALDGSGHLYVADIQLPGVVRLDLSTGQTINYAVIPDLAPCLQLIPKPCSPTSTARPPFPNDLAFDKEGNLYVTDSFQATVWKVPPGAGTAVVWFQSGDFDRALGANGIRLSPKDTEVCVAVTGPPGAIHCIALNDPSEHRVLVSFPTEGPDNMAFGQTGKLYVALANSNEVAVVLPDGNEEQRFSGPAQGPNGPIPWDAPAGVAFDNASGSLLVTNHALNTGLVLKNLFVVFDVYVNDRAHPLHRPAIS